LAADIASANVNLNKEQLAAISGLTDARLASQ